MASRENPGNYFWGGQVYGQPNPTTGNDETSVSSPQNGFDMDGNTVLTRHNQPEGAYVGAYNAGKARKLVTAIGCAYSQEGGPPGNGVWYNTNPPTGPWKLNWANAMANPVQGAWGVYAGCGVVSESTEHFLGTLWSTLGILGNGAFSITPFVNPIYCEYIVLRMPFNAGPIDGFIRDLAWYTGQTAPTGTSCFTTAVDTTPGGPTGGAGGGGGGGGGNGGSGGCGTNY